MLELTAGALALGLVPDIGGSVAYFRRDGVDLMRPLSAENLAKSNVLGVAMFPMLPYANRIADNAFDFGGKTWRFSANNPPEKFNVHGTGWHSQWQAEQHGQSVLLSLEHIAPDEPYSYRAAQEFSLTPDGLAVTMALTNKGPVAMPFGFGLHPWFDRDPDVELSFAAEHFFLEGPHGITGQRLATPPELDFRNGGTLPSTWRNNDYGGWDGSAEVRFPSRGLALRMDADPVFAHLMLYADPARAFFCVEPQSNAPCAFNWIGRPEGADLGTQILEPGETLAGTIRFSPRVLG